MILRTYLALASIGTIFWAVVGRASFGSEILWLHGCSIRSWKEQTVRMLAEPVPFSCCRLRLTMISWLYDLLYYDNIPDYCHLRYLIMQLCVAALYLLLCSVFSCCIYILYIYYIYVYTQDLYLHIPRCGHWSLTSECANGALSLTSGEGNRLGISFVNLMCILYNYI